MSSSRPFGDHDATNTRYYAHQVSSTSNSGPQQSPDDDQDQHELGPDAFMSLSSDSDKLAMEMVGISPTTFSSSVQFQVPRFMQDSFDPAILHSSTSAYAPLTSTASQSQSKDMTLAPVDYATASTGYQGSFIGSSAGSNAAFSAFRYPDAPTFPPIHMPTDGYQLPSMPTGDIPDSAISTTSNLAQPPARLPRSSALALNGLPIYSSSGFDMLDILARIATRPQPKVALGPVDMSCSFLVVDVTRDDSPIIYVSNTFTELTGYTEAEILGRNCRFLQAPPGVQLEKGGPREHTDIDSVTQMAQNLSLHRECQVTLVNYRKNGEAFINCVSIIPVIPGGNEPVRYHVGFQVDLAVQPLAIMKAVQTGSYVTNYSSTPLPPIIYQPNKLNLRAVSKDMSAIIGRIGGISPASMNDNQDRQKLSMTLLAESPDAILVISLKGSFLYVSPSISRLLKYEADYFLNKNISDICHPSDLAPTMRKVKESTTPATLQTTTPAGATTIPATSGIPPQEIQLVFRARCADGSYVWVDCPGKLHADTSRGRKALLLRLRRIDMPRLTWHNVNLNGGVSKDDYYLRVANDDRGLIVSCLRGIEELLGGKREDIVGKTLSELVIDDPQGTKREAIRSALAAGEQACGQQIATEDSRVVFCNILSATRRRNPSDKKSSSKSGGGTAVLATTEITFFPPMAMKEYMPIGKHGEAESFWTMAPKTMIVRLRVLNRRTMRMELPELTGPASVSAQKHLLASYQPTGYGLSTNEMTLAAAVLPRPITSPLQLFRQDASSSDQTSSRSANLARRSGYRVALQGDVNAIDEPVASDGDASPPEHVDNNNGGGNGPGSSTHSASPDVLGSSWLYELQQLRIRNERLRADVANRRREVRSQSRVRPQLHNALGTRATGRPSNDQIPTTGYADTIAPRVTASAWPVSFATQIGRSKPQSAPPALEMDGLAALAQHHVSTQLPQDGGGQKRTWSQTDMSHEWGHWNP